LFNSELQACVAVLAKARESVASGGDWLEYFLVAIVDGVFVLKRG
jgi:hypothetical protein